MAISTTRLRQRLRKGLSDRWLAACMLIPTVVLLVSFELYPFIQAVWSSFYSIDLYGTHDTFVGLDNFKAVLASPDTLPAFGRSAEFVAGSLLIQATMGMITALVLDQGLRGRFIWRGLNLFPYMVPAIVTTMAFRFAFNENFGAVQYGLLKLGIAHEPVPFLSDPHTVMFTVILISSWRHVPFFTIVLLARMQTIPREQIEAASVDGAGSVRVFLHVMLPWLMPVLLIALLLRTIWASVEFDFPYLTAFGGPLEGSTVVPILIYSLYTQVLAPGRAAALAILFSSVLLVVSLVYLRFYNRTEEVT